jgi:hypothetical protein
MAKAINPPKSIKVPDLGFTSDSCVDDYVREVDVFTKQVQEYCKANSGYEFAGDIIKFPIADGTADYIVFDASTLIHLAIWDAWEVPEAHIRGLRHDDIKHNVMHHRRINSLWENKGK